MERDFEKDIIELDAAIKSNAERDNTFTLSVLQRAKEIILQQKEKLKAYEDIGLTPEEILGRKMLAGWIPVVERTPEKPKENPLYDNKPLELYLVSVKNTDCVIRAFWNGASFTDGWEKLDVLAWMPLPEPYRPETLRGPGAKAGQDVAEPVFQSAT